MGIKEKIKKAEETTWVTNGLSEDEVKTTVELANISAKIERRRIELGMTQKEFAEYMGVSQGMVSKWESREYNFTVKSLNEICLKLNMQMCIDIQSTYTPKDYKVVEWSSEKMNVKKNQWMPDFSYEGAIA
jgi:transcriptional regulator with XRE-family HTH domain